MAQGKSEHAGWWIKAAKRWHRRWQRWRSWVGPVAAFVVGLVLLWWLDIDAGPVAAVAGAIAAFAAWKAATESSHAADRATEALGRAIKPKIDGGVRPGTEQIVNGARTGRWVASARIQNVSFWTASDIEVEVQLPGNRQYTFYFDRLTPQIPTRGDDRGSPGQSEEMELGTGKRYEECDGDIYRLTVRYSDERGLLRWEWVLEVRYGMEPHPMDGVPVVTPRTTISDRRVVR
jgi:hypothetical protein